MWVITGILAVAVIVILIEVPSLLKRKLRKELWVFSILLILGTGLSIAQGLHWNIPNPLDLMIVIYKPISNIIFGFLK